MSGNSLTPFSVWEKLLAYFAYCQKVFFLLSKGILRTAKRLTHGTYPADNCRVPKRDVALSMAPHAMYLLKSIEKGNDSGRVLVSHSLMTGYGELFTMDSFRDRQRKGVQLLIALLLMWRNRIVYLCIDTIIS